MLNYLTYVSSLLQKYPEFAEDIANSFSHTQYASKQWLIDQLTPRLPKPRCNILIIGGWYGSYLIPMLRSHNITLSDKDPDTIERSKILHGHLENVKFEVLDAEQPHTSFNVDVIINTSCEHMFTIGDRCVSNPMCLYALQACNEIDDPGHVNIFNNTDDFAAFTGLTSILFKGRQDLGHKNRFMVIGRK